MTETLTHAVTQPQPLAWALASGHCPVINSTTRPDMRHFGKLIGIHAGLHVPTRDELSAIATGPLRNHPGYDGEMRLPRGALVGVARLVGVVRKGLLDFQRMEGKSISGSMPTALRARIRPWWRGPWGWLLEDAVALPEPIPMRGAGGLWRLPGVTISGVGVVAMGPGLVEQWRKGMAER